MSKSFEEAAVAWGKAKLDQSSITYDEVQGVEFEDEPYQPGCDTCDYGATGGMTITIRYRDEGLSLTHNPYFDSVSEVLQELFDA